MRKVKKLVALLLSFCMMVSVIPMDTFAADTTVVMSEDENIDGQSTTDSSEGDLLGFSDITVEVDENARITMNGVNYTTLADAVAAAKSGDTITLYADNTESIILPAGVTLDTNGNAYTGTVSAPTAADGIYTVKKDNGVYTVEDPYIARIGETYYKTFAEAIKKALDGQEVTLLQNITVTSAVNVDKEIILNLNGKTITLDNVEESVVLYITADNVTVKNGTVTSVECVYQYGEEEYYNIGIDNYGANAVIEDVAIANVGYGICVAEGSVAVRGTTTINAVGTGVYNETQFTLGSGEINSENIAIDAEYGSTVTVSGGRIFAKQWAVYLDGAAFEMTGGSLESESYGIVPFIEEQTNTPSSVTISGGSIKADMYAFTNENYAAWNVTGGIYSALPLDETIKNVVKNGYVFVTNTDENTKHTYPYAVVPLTDKNAIAEITKDGVTTKYASVYDAMDSARTGDTITLLNDTVINSSITLKDGRELTLNMNNHNIKFENESAFRLLSYGDNLGGKLTVEGTGSISGVTGTVGTFYIEGSDTVDGTGKCEVVIGKDVTLKDGEKSIWFGTPGTGCYNATIDIYGTVSGKQPIYVSGTIHGTEANAPQIRIHNGAKIECTENSGLYLAGYAITTVETGAELTSGANVISIAAGELTVNGGTFIGGDEIGYDSGIGGSITFEKCSAIFVKQHTTNLPIKVTINGGEFKAAKPINQVTGQNGASADAEKVELLINGGKFFSTYNGEEDAYAVYSADKTGFIQGGYFSKTPDASYLATGKLVFVNTGENKTDYPYVVSKAVVSIGEEKYATLADAFANVQDNETITLLDDLTLTVDDKDGDYGNCLAINNGKTFTIDLGRYTLTGRLNLRHGDVTVKNGTVTNDTQPLNVYGSTDKEAVNYSVLTIGKDATVIASTNVVCMMNASGHKTYGAVINVAGTVKATDGNEDAAIYVSGNIGNDDVEDIAAMSVSNIINITGTVDGGDIMAIAMSGQATVNVQSGANVSGSTGLGVKRGVLNVSEGATISATGEKKAPAANGNGSEETGAAISVTSTYNDYGTIAVNVNGGAISSVYNSAVYVEHSGSTKVPFVKGYTIAIRGGELTSANGVPTVFVANRISGDFDGFTKAVIPATSTAKFTSDASAYCVSGYETKLVNGWYRVVHARVREVMVDTSKFDNTDGDVRSIVDKIAGNSAVTEAGATNIQNKLDETAQMRIVLETVEPKSATVAGKLVYDVKPIRVITDTETGEQTTNVVTNEELNQMKAELKFRLAVVTDSSFVYVSHTPDGKDTFEWTKKFNVLISGDQKYIELTASEFSKFIIKDPSAYSPVANITVNGETTYYFTLASAVEAALDGQSIRVVAANSEAVTVNKAITITGAVCSGLTAGEHYEVVASDTTYTFTTKKYTVTTSNDGDFTGNLTGGGIYAYGTEATITASNQAGYKFSGWYVGDEKVSIANTYKFTVTGDVTLVAKYIALEDVKLSLTVDASEFTITGISATQTGYQRYEFGTGAVVTVKYVDNNREFLYWANENEKVVSRKSEYTFILGANKSLHAVYAKQETEKDALIVFLSAFDQILLAQTCTAEDAIAFPDIIPSKMGYEFDKWVFEGSETEATVDTIQAAIADNNVIKVVPSYKSNDKKYNITVKYCLNAQEVFIATYESLVGEKMDIKAADEYENAKFMYWTDAEGNILSYSQIYPVRSTTDVVMIAVYDNAEEVEVKGTAAITGIMSSVVNSANKGTYYKLSFTETFDIPEKCTLIATGFVRSLDVDAATEANMNLEGTNLKIYTSKISAPVTRGVFTQSINTYDPAAVYYMRAYVQYIDSEGAIQTVYSDIVNASYNGLQGQ